MIKTNRLFIRPLYEQDYIQMVEYMQNPEVLRYEKMEPFNLETMHSFTKDVIPYKSFYAILLNNTDTLIGHLYFSVSGPKEFNEYTLGYIIHPSYQNKGYCTEAAKAMIDYGFNVLNLHRVTAKCNPQNVASWKVMEKVGMKKEGLLRKRVCFKYDINGDPIYWDELVYGLLQDEWNSQKKL